MKKFKHIILLIRLNHWIKNILVFTPLFFAQEIFTYKFIDALYSFLVFCFAASSVYIINDIFDIEYDKKHPTKKDRPLASGKISIHKALFVLSFLLILSGVILYFFIPQLVFVIFSYLVLNILYSAYLKHIIIIDILLISFLYLIRIIAGGVATYIYISDWLILCTIFISLFIIVGKRKSELSHINKRKVLNFYSVEILNVFLAITASLSILSYSLYTVLVVRSIAVYSIFFVLMGIFRYIFLIYSSRSSEYPEKVIFSDRIIFWNIILWTLFMYFIFYTKSL